MQHSFGTYLALRPLLGYGRLKLQDSGKHMGDDPCNLGTIAYRFRSKSTWCSSWSIFLGVLRKAPAGAKRALCTPKPTCKHGRQKRTLKGSKYQKGLDIRRKSGSRMSNIGFLGLGYKMRPSSLLADAVGLGAEKELPAKTSRLYPN